MKKKEIKEKFHKSVLYKVFRIIETSATVGLLVSIGFFVYETYQTKGIVGNLKSIEQSLSTRYIGIFPEYLNQINGVLKEAIEQNDDIVIFEDLLFYGALYNREEFKKMINLLDTLASQKRTITIAYYDINSNMFGEVIQESWMNQKDLSELASKKKALIGKPKSANVDKKLNEEYFNKYRSDNKIDFENRIKAILKPMYNEGDNILFQQMDSIKTAYCGKPIDNITFNDISKLYNQMTNLLKNSFKNSGINLIPLNGYLTMSCWSNGNKALIAFPGKYAADEIGFISQDGPIIKYIKDMLNGVQNISK